MNYFSLLFNIKFLMFIYLFFFKYYLDIIINFLIPVINFIFINIILFHLIYIKFKVE